MQVHYRSDIRYSNLNECTLLYIQSDFNTFLGWWFDTGIYTKMALNVGVNQRWSSNFWSVPTNHEKETLHFSNVLPLFIFFGVAIVISIFAFGMEQICLKEKPALKNVPRHGYTEDPIIPPRLDSILEEAENSGHRIYGPCLIRPKLTVKATLRIPGQV